jgi:hypothetical protein
MDDRPKCRPTRGAASATCTKASQAWPSLSGHPPVSPHPGVRASDWRSS